MVSSNAEDAGIPGVKSGRGEHSADEEPGMHYPTEWYQQDAFSSSTRGRLKVGGES